MNFPLGGAAVGLSPRSGAALPARVSTHPLFTTISTIQLMISPIPLPLLISLIHLVISPIQLMISPIQLMISTIHFLISLILCGYL